MFGNIMDIMSKIGSIKEKFTDLKNQLDSEVFTTTSTDGSVKIIMTKLATVKDIELVEGIEKEQLEDMLVTTLNHALSQVKEEAIEKAKKTAKENIPNIPGMPF